MPELPEVETARRGIAPLVSGRRVVSVDIRNPHLRWPVPETLAEVCGQVLTHVRRRAKYLLLPAQTGTIILHLGMSGSLRVVPERTPPGRYDHVDFLLDHRQRLRLRDPRRFGCVLWVRTDPEQHPLLKALGPEPLSGAFSGAYLHRRARDRDVAIKAFIMDSKTVGGVGNIYASEALFKSGIHPHRPAGRIALKRYVRLADAIKETLTEAIAAGGTTLRDFTRESGRPGYFRTQLLVYGRHGEPCPRCTTPIQRRVIGQRSSFLCPRCQR
ncbi:MAG: bifunctional DNA-formamidopyrimidine glycosylase/DNA-(apurinic or apyrimidinic site) lyase [Gammaproteobacteria bacterium]|nr:bifunctional DNA-formamidopyrimidine glycosylase/DNA-(apurinic or apyrimidinic site) lyase [Gammaproteobacteria bacterium]